MRVPVRMLARAAVDELHRRDREHVAGHHARGHRARDVLGVFGFEVDVHVVRFAVGRRDDVVDGADEQPVVFDIGPRRQPIAHVRQLRDDADVVVEPAGGLQQQACRDQSRDQQHRRAQGHQLLVGGAPPVEI